MAGDIHVRTATAADELEVRRVLDAAMLAFENLETRLESGDVLVAGDRQGGSADSDCADRAAGDGNSSTRADERILGTLVLVPPETDGCRTEPASAGETNTSPEPAHKATHIAAIAVRRRHRARGIGRTLVEHALESGRVLTARFDADVRPFYESLGFTIEQVENDRFCGKRELSATSEGATDGV